MRQLWSVLVSRRGLGALMVAVFGAVALGVVPNLVQAVSDSVWVFAGVFVVGVGLTVVGWVLIRDRGVGVVVALFPPQQNTGSWVEALVNASRAAHSSTMVIDRHGLGLDEFAGADRRARVRLAVKVLDARVSEYTAAKGNMERVGLYPSAQLADGFELGRALRSGWPQPYLTVMHSARAGSGAAVVPGLVLSGGLQAPPTPAQQALIAPHLAADSTNLVAVPDAPKAARLRLGLVVRVASQSSMVDDAVFVARTGKVVRDDGRHTGYVLDEADPAAAGMACGAYVVVDTTSAYLPERAEVFQAMVAYIGRCWRDAYEQWRAQVGDPPAGVLFFHGPLPIAIGLGWLLDGVDIVPHEMRLARGAAGAVA